MPDFTITLTTKAVQRLQAAVQRYNDNQGTKLTLKDFLLLHLRELAIANELAQASQTLAEEAKRGADEALHASLQAAINAKRDQLLQEL